MKDGDIIDGVGRIATSFACWAARHAMEDSSIWDRLGVQRSRNASELGISSRLTFARALAETAWRERRFADYVIAMTPVVQHLTEVERKKFAYSKKKNQTGADEK